MRRLLLLPLALLLVHCESSTPTAGESNFTPPPGARGLPQIINVSAYDPKERQRSGRSYSEHDVSALRANGAYGLIARVGKGGNLDEKCATFLASADRAGMLVGVYYRVQKHVSMTRQADQMVSRVEALRRSRSWKASHLLLVGDYDGDLNPSDIVSFMDRVYSRTRVVPVAYLENSTHLKQTLSRTTGQTRAKLLSAPYWAALYAHDSGDGPIYPAPVTPEGLAKQYGVWRDWAMWQYGGVAWENRRSRAKVYNHGRFRFPTYFGDIDRPLERNVFNGSPSQLLGMWQKHGLPLN